MVIPNDDDSGGTATQSGAGNQESRSNDGASSTNHSENDRSFDPFKSDNSERACRATGKDDLSDLMGRATGDTEDRADPSRGDHSAKVDSSFSLLNGRTEEPRFHLSDELHNPEKDPFSLGDFDLSERTKPGERTADWVGRDGLDPLRGYADALKTMNDFIAGVDDFLKNYEAMKQANTIGADKFFHCNANCEAAQRGLGGEAASIAIGYGREAIDSVKNVVKGMSWKESIEDCKGDLEANRVGREAGATGQRCIDACRPFRPRGL